MIEGVIHHCTEMEVDRQYVDSHGQSTVAFAFCRLLGFLLLPRLKAIHSQTLYRPETGKADAYADLQLILGKPIDWDLVRQQYDQMIRYTTALRLGTAETEAILRRFTRHNVQHPTYKAFAELGKAIKTIFLCECNARRSIGAPIGISFDRHSLFTDLTNLSAAVVESLLRLRGRQTSSIAVNDQVPLAEEQAIFAVRETSRHLQHPRLIRVRRDSANDDSASGKIDHEEDIVCDQAPPTPYLDCKEVTGRDRFPMRLEKHRPRNATAARRRGLDQVIL